MSRNKGAKERASEDWNRYVRMARAKKSLRGAASFAGVEVSFFADEAVARGSLVFKSSGILSYIW